MDNQRLFLYGALGLLLLLIWQTWQVDYGPGAQTPPNAEGRAAEERAAEQKKSSNDLPGGPIESDSPPTDKGADAKSGTDEALPEQGSDASESQSLASGERVHVVTDLLEVELDTRGGDLRRALLRKYKVESGSEQPVELLTDSGGELFVAQSGLQAGDRSAPSHHATYSAKSDEYRLAEGQDTLTVPLEWSGDGVRVTKTYTFHRDSYVVDIDFRVENTGDTPWVGRQYRQLQREQLSDDDKPYMTRAFYGPVYYSPEDKYEQVDVEDLAESPLKKTFSGGWAGVVEHYFVAAWLPEAKEKETYYTRLLGKDGERARYLVGLYSPAQRIAAGKSADFATRLYVGPKETGQLSGLAQGLPLTIDYGYLSFLSAPLFTVLDWLHSLVGNWGFAIILLTVLIKAVFYKLSEKSYRSMAKMRQAQPKIKRLKERYGDDREKMGRAMMDLYKTEKINPLGGCLPIVVQIPVFIALYWMLRGSVELRNADFILWINDLSARDPWYVLPVLMGVSMWAQQKLNPAPVDPMQQKIFMALPFVFTFFFMFFPAGLVLYWLTNNVLSIAQQYYITHHVVGSATGSGSGPPAKKNKGGRAPDKAGDKDKDETGDESADQDADSTDDAAEADDQGTGSGGKS